MVYTRIWLSFLSENTFSWLFLKQKERLQSTKERRGFKKGVERGSGILLKSLWQLQSRSRAERGELEKVDGETLWAHRGCGGSERSRSLRGSTALPVRLIPPLLAMWLYTNSHHRENWLFGSSRGRESSTAVSVLRARDSPHCVTLVFPWASTGFIKMTPANQSSLPPHPNNNNGCHLLSETLCLTCITPNPYSGLRVLFTESTNTYFRIYDQHFKNEEMEAQQD